MKTINHRSKVETTNNQILELFETPQQQRACKILVEKCGYIKIDRDVNGNIHLQNQKSKYSKRICITQDGQCKGV